MEELAVGAQAPAESDQESLAAMERGTTEHEACLREIFAQYFIERLASSTEGGEKI